jgi:galactonate dehydratase
MVKITDDNGEYGWSEALFEDHDLAVECCHDEVIVCLIGIEVM